MFVVHTILFLYIFVSDKVILSIWFHAFLQSKQRYQLYGIAHYTYCTDIAHLTHIYQILKILIVGTVRTVSTKCLFVPFHLCPSNIKGLHLVHCVHGSAFSNISCLTFVCYCLPSLVLFVTFNSKESKFALTPKDIILHIKWLSNFHDNSHGELMLQITDFETFHSFY